VRLFNLSKLLLDDAQGNLGLAWFVKQGVRHMDSIENFPRNFFCFLLSPRDVVLFGTSLVVLAAKLALFVCILTFF